MNSSGISRFFSFMLPTDHIERFKILLLSGTFLLLIAAYTVVYDLKNSIFMSMVGKEYVPYAKIGSMFVLIPFVLFYAFLVDRVRRHQLLYFYGFFYIIFGLISAYIIGHPVMGLSNTDSSPYRFFGWFFYFLVEGFSPFMVSVFWAFANSISSPKSAKEHYGLLVTGSKIGGMFSAGSAWLLLTLHDSLGGRLYSDALNHQILLLFFTALMTLVPIMVYLLVKKIPGSYLHGYEAVYKFEKEKKREEQEEEIKEHEAQPSTLRSKIDIVSRFKSILSGLQMILMRPYILGIFSMVFFYEVLNAVLGYQRLGVAQAASTNVSDISSILYEQMFAMHFIGFFISLFGTRTLLHFFGEKICLVLIPFSSGILLFYFWFTYTPFSLLLVFVTLKSVNYAFAQPVRESLYIPTVKDVKFKSKSWIDAFGSKLARGTGSWFNLLADKLGPALFFPLHGAIFVSIIGTWLVSAFLLGKRYEKAVRRNEVIS